MRWMKHLTTASEDEKLAEVLDEFGAEGYGVYWLILERIGYLMEKGSDKTSARYSVKKWAKFCGKSPKVFRKFLDFFSKLSLFNSEICEKNSDFLIIDCPNLLKYRDEYSKKSGQTPDNDRTNSGETPDQDTETETETDKKKEKRKNNTIPKPDSVSEQTWKDFLTHRKNKKANLTQTALNRIMSQAKKAGWTLEDALSEMVSRGWTGFNSDWVQGKTKTDYSNMVV